MFKVCKHQLLSSLGSPRFYIALFVGIVVHSLNILPFLELSKAIGEPIGITEGFLLFNNDIFSLAAASLGIIILISDIPFSSQNETYTLLRLSRLEWVSGKILYLLCACSIYYLITFLSGVVLQLGNLSFNSEWSVPMQMLANDTSGSLSSQFGISFPGYVLYTYSPFQAFSISLVCSIAYAFILSLITFWFNLKCKASLAYFLSAMFHVVNYFMTKIFPTSAFWKYSLFANSSLRYHRFEIYTNSHKLLTVSQSCLVFFVFEMVLFVLIYRAVRKYDFKITVGTNQ